MISIVFSSTHPHDDPRVERSVNALAKLGSVRVLLNDEYAAPGPEAAALRDVQLIPIKVGFTRFLGLKAPRYKRWARTIRNTVGKADVVYIHESGMVGFLLGSALKETTGAKIVCDYHDSLEYEIFYQLDKLGLAKRWIIRRYMSWIKKYVQAPDAVVGISQAQLDQLFGGMTTAKPALALPNIRPPLESDYIPVDEEPELVWIGNVNKLNNIESMIDLYGHSPRVNRLKIFGAADGAYAAVLGRAAVKPVEFMGKYQHDLEIQTKLRGRSICVLSDAPDPFGTDLNEICSPNKVFSAINIGIPLLVHAKLKNVCDMILPYQAGGAYRDADEFHRKLDDIIVNYEKYRTHILALKKALRDRDYDNELLHFLTERVGG